jgi:hypothetical protein
MVTDGIMRQCTDIIHFYFCRKGTYEKQTHPLRLTSIDPSLTGFEGGFAGTRSHLLASILL